MQAGEVVNASEVFTDAAGGGATLTWGDADKLVGGELPENSEVVNRRRPGLDRSGGQRRGPRRFSAGTVQFANVSAPWRRGHDSFLRIRNIDLTANASSRVS
ncbi:hypothetical protein ACFFWC_31760 [Plantactinospora siamensis]|uniref:Uncharacterized protein n=1 Tax=Plantactinospora siamensis TaxID=555372 RepID=A0ABV6P342_9ACTN